MTIKNKISPQPGDIQKIEVVGHFKDKWWRLNNLYYIINEHGKKVKFQCNPLQKKFYDNLWYLNMLLKARQFGGTTFTDIYFLDDCIFTRNLEAGIIAHNRDDAQKIFRRKVKFPYDNLPDGLKNQCALTTDSRQELAFSNGSVIYVATSIRSGTVQRLHISEHAKICRKYPDKAEEIKTGSLNAIHPGNIVVIESTAEGRYGDFYDFCQIARKSQQEGRPLSKMDYKFHFFPWFWDAKNTLDIDNVVITAEMQGYFDKIEGAELGQDGSPLRLTAGQKAWYVKKEAILGEKMLQEYPSTVEEAFQATIRGAYFATQMAGLRKRGQITTVPYEPGLPVNTAWDLGVRVSPTSSTGGATVIVFHQRHRLENRIIDYYINNDRPLSHYVKHLREKGYLYGTHYLPHDVGITSLSTGKTRLVTLRKLMPGERLIVNERSDLADGIETTRNFLPTCWIDEVKCAALINALDAYQRQPDDKHGGFKDKPLHNWASDPADGFRSLAVGYNPSTSGTGRRRRRPVNAMAV
ncbi:MAG: hypothetical protein KAS66_10730 [Candidatus Omnitrophica bacterium]|nr:hypothetical protein [Candidatus Omnitrophota bacterium]